MKRQTLQLIAQELQVTTYLDYRDFLEALYQRMKSQTSPYSYQAFAEDLGFSATNVLRLVITRQRGLSAKSAQTAAKALGLRRQQRKYFVALVQYINARGPAHKERLFLKMVAAKQEDIASHDDRERLDYYSEWYHPVVRELLRLADTATPEAMAAKLYPAVSPEKIRRSLALLESLRIIAKDGKTGTYRPLQESPILLPSDATAGHLAITQYHQASIDVAREAVAKVPAGQREFNALTLGLSQQAFQDLVAKIRKLCAEALALEDHKQQPECVAQLNVQLFSLTKWEDKD